MPYDEYSLNRTNYRLGIYAYRETLRYTADETLDALAIRNESQNGRQTMTTNTTPDTGKFTQAEFPNMPERITLYTPENHGPYRFYVRSSFDRTQSQYPDGFNTLPETESYIRSRIEEFVSEFERTYDPDTNYYGTRVPSYRIYDTKQYGFYACMTRQHCLWQYDTRDTMAVDTAILRTLDRIARNAEDNHGTACHLAQRLADAMRSRYGPGQRRAGNYLLPEYETGQLSYLPVSKLVNPDETTQNQKGRVSGKPVRVLKTLFPEIDGTDREYELLNNALVASMQSSGEFAVLTGDDLLDAYDRDSWADSVTWHSCMSYSYCRSYLALYAENPDKISLLVLRNADGQTMARSLIWQTADGPYQDRIYASDDRETERMKRYAIDTLGCQTYAGDVSGLTPPSTDEFPYCDTYYYGMPESDGTLTLSTDHYGQYYEFTNTDGTAGGTVRQRMYAVTFTRTIIETVTIYVEASDEYDAQESADEQLDDLDASDIYRSDTGTWVHDYTDLD